MGDLLGSPCVADFGWVSFLAYPNLFGNKGFEEEEEEEVLYNIASIPIMTILGKLLTSTRRVDDNITYLNGGLSLLTYQLGREPCSHVLANF